MPTPLHWKKSLWVLWGANFSVMCGMNLVLPFLPLYIGELGVHELGDVVRWTGWIVAAQFITSFLTQPLWGATLRSTGTQNHAASRRVRNGDCDSTHGYRH